METTGPIDQVNIVELRGAHQPCDRGLTSLGLLMQLAGAVGVALMLTLAMLPISGRGIASFGPPTSGVCVDDAGTSCTCDSAQTYATTTPKQPRGGSNAPILFLVAIACVARSLFHRAAGIALVHDTDDGPRRHALMYTLVAAVHTPVILVFLRTFGADTALLVTAGAMLLAWPITLQLVVRSRNFSAAASQGSAASFEGIGALMITFALTGIAMVVLGAATLLHHANLNTAAVAALCCIGALSLARSAMQLRAGTRLRNDLSLRDALANIRSYRRFAVASTIVLSAAVAVYGLGNWATATTALLVILTASLLSAWPRVLARICEERAFAADMELDETPAYNAAADNGLVSLGWLLLAVGVVSLAYSVPVAVCGIGNYGIDANATSWWFAGVAAMEVWAALELIAMTDRHQQVMMTTGLMTTMVVLFALWPSAIAVAELHSATAANTDVTVIAGQHVFACCIHLGVAIAAIVFARGADSSPTLARVHTRGTH